MEDGFALVTGASAGIGAVYADRLAKRGYDLILVARNGEKLKAQAEQLQRRYGRTVEVVVADLIRRPDLMRVEELLRTDPSVRVLVNNAGIGDTASVLESDVGRMSDMIALNVEALTRLTLAVVPGLVARGGGTIINIASIVAIAPEVLNGVYGGTKAFVLAFSRSLKSQLEDKGVRIQVVMPGATATDFWNLAGIPLEHLPSEIVMPVTDMVDAALKGLDHGEFVTIPALPDIGDWVAFESARVALIPNLSGSAPAARYRAIDH